MRRRSAATLAAAAALLGACGDKEDAGSAGSGEDEGLRTCLELWEGEHVGSTHLKYLARTHPRIFAKVVRAPGGCQVEYATPGYRVYGRFIEKRNRAGPWSLAAGKGTAEEAERVVESANAHARPDGGLDIGAP